MYEAGVKGSDMGKMYYNEKRPQPEFSKCIIDTSQKIGFHETIIEKKIFKS